MNKRLITIILSLAIAAVPAFAGIVTVDFGELGITTVDLNAASPTALPPGTPYVITRLGFFYDPMGGSEEVSVDSGGIFGNVAFDTNGNPVGPLTGALTILFPYAVTGLNFTFTNDPTTDVYGWFTSALDPAVQDLVINPTGTGTFSYGAAFGGAAVGPFSRVDLYFGDGVTSTAFTVDSMQYDYTPEPVSFLLMGTGLVGLGCFRRLRRRS